MLAAAYLTWRVAYGAEEAYVRLVMAMCFASCAFDYLIRSLESANGRFVPLGVTLIYGLYLHWLCLRVVGYAP